jgi:hypothetical protein
MMKVCLGKVLVTHPTRDYHFLLRPPLLCPSSLSEHITQQLERLLINHTLLCSGPPHLQHLSQPHPPLLSLLPLDTRVVRQAEVVQEESGCNQGLDDAEVVVLRRGVCESVRGEGICDDDGEGFGEG